MGSGLSLRESRNDSRPTRKGFRGTCRTGLPFARLVAPSYARLASSVYSAATRIGVGTAAGWPVSIGSEGSRDHSFQDPK